MSGGPARLGEIRNSHVNTFEWASPARWDEITLFAHAYTVKTTMAGKTSPQNGNFRWSAEMVKDLICTLKSYKCRLDYRGIDFDADRPLQYRELRKEMAKLCEENRDVFGPYGILYPQYLWRNCQKRKE